MSTQPRPAERPTSIRLDLDVRDPEVVEALCALSPGPARDEFARTALRIGVLALGQAQGRIDAERLRREGETLLQGVGQALTAHQRDVAEKVAQSLKDYFDPKSGRFNERVERLVSKDGELEQLLRRQVGAQDSELARTLGSHLGEGSALMKALDPAASNGVIASLTRAVEGQLAAQRERIVGEFSLDRDDSALSRLVGRLTERHGNLEESLKKRIDEVVKEFSLDDEGSALGRLVAQVNRAQERISSEFSLDDKTSALARMQAELLETLKAQAKESRDFQADVKAALEGMRTRKEAEARSTTHGATFEAALQERLASECRRTGDLLEETGATTGLTKQCKVGDFVVTLGADSRAAGSRIVIEAKESGAYGAKAALDEIETARKNRGAEIGIFCWSRRSAPASQPPLARHGNDVIVTWDADDEASDAFLVAALSLARALCTRAATERDSQAADLEAIERAIRAVEKQAGALAEIATSAGTIESGARRILDRVRIAQKDFADQVTTLDRCLKDLRNGG